MTNDDWVVSGGAGALDFDGVNDFVNLGNNVSLPSATRVSFSAWVWRATQGQVWAFSRYNSSPANDRADYFGVNNVTANGQVAFSMTGATINDYLDFYSTQQIIAGQWNHIAATCIVAGNSSVCNMWLNGQPVTVNSNHNGTRPTSWNANNAVPYAIGRIISFSGTNIFTSSLTDDVRAYNRALTDPEIRLLASKRGIGLQPRPKQYTFYQFPSGSKRRRILTGMT
jgi:hypothetical protein